MDRYSLVQLYSLVLYPASSSAILKTQRYIEHVAQQVNLLPPYLHVIYMNIFSVKQRFSLSNTSDKACKLSVL